MRYIIPNQEILQPENLYNFFMKTIFYTVLILTSLSLSATESSRIMKKSRYIDMMEKVLSAYSIAHIDRYFKEVKTNGLTEHGFPRLTADIGILIAHGKRLDLIPRFVKMMDLCCSEIPKYKNIANEFSIKEIIFCLMELEQKRIFPQAQIDNWKAKFKDVTVEKCYRVYAEKEDSKVFNWAAFCMVSEWMRYHIGAGKKDMRFIDIQAASQLQWNDENGMYRDPHEPMVYDLVTRGLFSVMLHFGYRGKYFKQWDDALKRAGTLTAKMVSVTGTLPYGGRSNQFLHNESQVALIMEYEAARYAKAGDMETASRFRGVVRRALENMESHLAEKPINHVKNRFPRKTGYGCEIYAYFDKYMITAASFLYVAYLLCDDTIPVSEPDDISGETLQLSDHFHKLFLRAGEYFMEYDYRADYTYDASGMGRLHRKGAPETICLSTPGTDTPRYKINVENAIPFAVAPELKVDGKWLSGADRDAVHKIQKHSAGKESATAEISCTWQDKHQVVTDYQLDKSGMKITVSGKGEVGLMIPAFTFDGKEKTVISNSGSTLTIRYRDWECRWELQQGKISDTGKTGYNRNGHYRIFRAENFDTLTAVIRIERQK